MESNQVFSQINQIIDQAPQQQIDSMSQDQGQQGANQVKEHPQQQLNTKGQGQQGMKQISEQKETSRGKTQE